MYTTVTIHLCIGDCYHYLIPLPKVLSKQEAIIVLFGGISADILGVKSDFASYQGGFSLISGTIGLPLDREHKKSLKLFKKD